LTKKAPYKGLGADSEEKREPVGDIDTAAVDGLKRLTQWPIREADIGAPNSVLLTNVLRSLLTVSNIAVRPRDHV
jgi:hypothetical protein